VSSAGADGLGAGAGVGSAREEAERLVAAGLGAIAAALQEIEARRQLKLLAERMLSSEQLADLAAGLGGCTAGGGSAAGGSAGFGFATGSADCCICPVCRLIAVLRDPSPEFAERLASAAGDIAVGLAALLRAINAALAKPAAPAREHGPDSSEILDDLTPDTVSDFPRSTEKPEGS
jgi:hypothetical protein